MDSIKNSLLEISGMNFRQLITQFIVLGSVISSVLMLWKGLMVVTNRESPIVVVLTGSMEPSFFPRVYTFYKLGLNSSISINFSFFKGIWI